MGASSVRFAHGRLDDKRIEFRVVQQEANTTVGRCWNLDHLVQFCRTAAGYAGQRGASVGIDSWGVDHGFVDEQGSVVFGPVMYRDPSHLAMSDEMEAHRSTLFKLTGIAHQPFNTLYQLAARRRDAPHLVDKSQWYLIPDLLGFLLTGRRNHERTQSSTTQLMGLDGKWCAEAFDLIGWPIPDLQPQPSGESVGIVEGANLVTIASHDTGSAVVGVGGLGDDEAYLNVGTWALLGVVLDRPCVSEEAYKGNWTNEWGHDGRIRFLKNIPGFYVLNRLHEELDSARPIGLWLAERDKAFEGRFDPHAPELYNPDSMVKAVSGVSSVLPGTVAQFAQAALASLVETIGRDLASLEKTTKRINNLRVVGGGSRSAEFCQALADHSGRTVEAGPDESTVLGNLALQFVATGEISNEDVPFVVRNSVERTTYIPGGS